MDVERKVALPCVYESNWDMQPPEIQAYILAFKFSQERIDEVMQKGIDESVASRDQHVCTTESEVGMGSRAMHCPPSEM